jgi:NACalpha-BTF3-like transcription factor
MVQLDPRKTILVFSHSHNSFDKKELLTEENKSWKKTELKVDDFVKEPEVKKFFLETIETLLEKYDEGTLKHKPDVIENLNKIKEEKDKMIAMFKQLGTAMSLNINGKPVIMQNEEVVGLLNKLVNDNRTMQSQLQAAMQLYPPMQIPIVNQGVKQVPTKYAQVFLQVLLERSMIYEQILQQHNLMPEPSKLPQIPNLLDVMPELAQLNQQQPNVNFSNIPTNDNNVNNEDIDTIMQQTECSRGIALKFYKENNKDIVDCIMKIFELKESGDYEKIEKEAEEAAKNASKASETDIDLVVQQTECSPERAAQALDKHNQDIVEAIMEITNEQDEAKSSEEVNAPASA